MGRHIAIVAKLYGAWVVIALAVVCGIFAERAPSHLKLVPFNLEVFQLEIPLTDIVLTRAVLGFLVLFVLLRVAFMDYSRLYPKVMEMDVFFDEAGIDRALRRLTPAERRELEIPDDYRAHQQTTGAAAFDHKAVLRGPFLLNQKLGTVDEVEEGVFLLHEHAILPPLFAQLVAAADMCDGEGHTAIEQADAIAGKSRRHAVAVGPVTVEEERRFSVTRETVLVDD